MTLVDELDALIITIDGLIEQCQVVNGDLRLIREREELKRKELEAREEEQLQFDEFLVT